jgi:GPI mannosyltransferase 1 subunit M
VRLALIAYGDWQDTNSPCAFYPSILHTNPFIMSCFRFESLKFHCRRPKRIFCYFFSKVPKLFSLLFSLLLTFIGVFNAVAVKYTDIDYEVVNDGARFMSNGGSPYERATYRYTPLLAGMLLPNIWLDSKVFGKVIFVIFDMIIGAALYLIAQMDQKPRFSGWPIVCASLWLFNPIAINVSTRGNSEAIVGSLVLVSLYLLMRGNQILSSLIFGLAVHFKIYPIIFSVAIFFYIDRDMPFRRDLGVVAAVLEQLFRWRRIRYAVITASVLAVFTAVFYKIYGWTFLYETYLYHVVRKDHRHNFSVYFYELYLSSAPDQTDEYLANFSLDLLARVGSFLPQLVALAALTIRFSQRDLPFALFGMTVAFVAFNKVSTVQYFVWYFSLLPLIVSRLNVSVKDAVVVFGFWAGSQALWLGMAFLLEFKSRNTFFAIWCAGILFFASHIGTLCFFIKRHAIS